MRGPAERGALALDVAPPLAPPGLGQRTSRPLGEGQALAPGDLLQLVQLLFVSEDWGRLLIA